MKICREKIAVHISAVSGSQTVLNALLFFGCIPDTQQVCSVWVPLQWHRRGTVYRGPASACVSNWCSRCVDIHQTTPPATHQLEHPGSFGKSSLEPFLMRKATATLACDCALMMQANQTICIKHNDEVHLNMGAIELIGGIVYICAHATPLSQPLTKARLNGYSDRAPNICCMKRSITFAFWVFFI